MRAALVVGVVLLGGCATGPHDSPRHASLAEFCAAGYRFSQAASMADGAAAARKLRDTGTPPGIPPAARRGFEVVVDLVTRSKDERELERRYSRLDARQRSSVGALDGYISKTCGGGDGRS